MNRRDALGRVALLMGGALSAPTMVAFLQGCNKSGDATSAMTFPFSPERQNLISEVAELIIPKTDTPGAKDAKVGPFIEMMLKDCYEAKDQSSFEKGLEQLEDKGFLKASPQEQTKILTDMEAQSKEELSKAGEDKKKYTEAGKEYTDAGVPFFRLMKELTLLGYFTSEEGATMALEYVPVPGRYDGCIDYKPGQKAWAM
ncbi:gluconate 2-dehydrogenase subunit 3 family protein [Dyadobacter tibetensis]|uniref:gluconate 2-dehydrogenase subunit 3 family protein n=1 Tax=Dyadobacter tibetensis TaxID=1211851 RepID=UPI000472D0BA|nr:gluconate 2-dehydrogenase subunit 3 family protein [Dyadobacter tibetensis]